MNTTLRNLFIFVTGIAIGSIATKKFMERIVEEEIESMRETLRDALKKKEDQIIRDVEGIGDMVSATVTVEEKTERGRRRYHKVVEELGYGNTDADEEYRDHKDISDRTNDRSVKDRPYVISCEQFSEEADHYDKLTWYYYDNDDTLTDENEEIVTDISHTVGDDALSSFGDDTEDPDMVHVRNDKLQIDYEIIRLNKSYAETVLGYTDDRRGGRK